MLPPAIVEQQAKLGVSAEESKTQRLKRQQARFRDRGGAFVPSTTNPLVDILLARTVSGESPSKGRLKNVSAKRLSLRKPRQGSPARKAGATTATEESKSVATNSRSKRPSPRKRKTKVVKPQDLVIKPPAKRRGTARGKRKGQGSETEQLMPTNTKSKPTSKEKGKRIAPSTSDEIPKAKTKAKTKTSSTKQVAKVLDSDDDQTLVEVSHKVKSTSKRNIQYEEGGETDDAPIVKKRVVPRVGTSKASGAKTVTHVKAGEAVGTESLEKTFENGEEKMQNEKRPKTNAKKRLARCDEDEDDVAILPAKKGKNSTSTKPKATIETKSALGPIKEVKEAENTKCKANGKARAVSDHVIAEVQEDSDNEPLHKHVPKLKKRKKENNHDDRPRKVVKFSETGTTHSSSQKLKENWPDERRERVSRSVAEDQADAPRPKLATEPPSRANTPKGPPREVIERIKASAARHLRCVDSEPDELDCLS